MQCKFSPRDNQSLGRKDHPVPCPGNSTNSSPSPSRFLQPLVDRYPFRNPALLRHLLDPHLPRTSGLFEPYVLDIFPSPAPISLDNAIIGLLRFLAPINLDFPS
jgi:hypothetical protein